MKTMNYRFDLNPLSKELFLRIKHSTLLNRPTLKRAFLFISASLVIVFSGYNGFAQRVPSLAENIEFLSTFSKDAPSSWGDDDNVQVYFVSVSKTSTRPFYIRVFDADIGGAHDMAKGPFDSQTSFSVYGGNSCYSSKAAKGVNPEKGYDSGLKIVEKTIGAESTYDNKWMTLGPFNPREGEYDKFMDAYIFKFIIEGQSGNDGNLYYFFLSSKSESNVEIPGSNAFCYEMSFRVPRVKNKIPHLYPFIDSEVIKVKIHNFDFDNGGEIRLTSVAKNSHVVKAYGDNNWVTSIHDVESKERNTSYDINLLDAASFNNDMTIFVTNQYDETLPFFTKPINGVPKYTYSVGVKYQRNNF